MVQDLGNNIGKSIRDVTPPKPERKIFTPNVSPNSPEAREYAWKHGANPHELGNQIKQSILEGQKSGLPYGDTYRRPMVEFGAQGFHPSRIFEVPGEYNITAGYSPPGNEFPADVLATGNTYGFGGFDVAVYDTLRILGEDQRLLDDYIVTMEGSDINSVKHELIHRAFTKLMSDNPHTYKKGLPRGGKFKEVEFYNKNDSRTRTVKFTEEDVVKLLDFLSGDKVQLATEYFGNGEEAGFGRQWNNESVMGGVITSPGELLQSPDVQKLLGGIQQFAAEELKKQGINVPIRFDNSTKRDLENMPGKTIDIGTK